MLVFKTEKKFSPTMSKYIRSLNSFLFSINDLYHAIQKRVWPFGVCITPFAY